MNDVEQTDAPGPLAQPNKPDCGTRRRLRLPGPLWCGLIAFLVIVAVIAACVWLPYQRTQSIVADCRAMGASVRVETFEPAWVTGLVSRWPDLGDYIEPLFWRITSINGANDDRVLLRVKNCPEVKKVSAYGPRITDRGVAALLTMPKLRAIYLGQTLHIHPDATRVTDEGLRQLAIHDSLTLVTVRSHQITGAGLSAFRDRANIDALGIGGENFIESELEHIARMPNLKYLRLFDLEVTAEGAAHLEELSHCERLWLRNVHMSPEAWQAVGRLGNLRNLGAIWTTISDADLFEVGRLSKLEQMAVYEGQISDTGLKHLGQLKSLRSLEIVNADVTDVGVSFLADHLDLTNLALESTSITSTCVEDLIRFPSLRSLGIHDTPLSDSHDAVSRLSGRISRLGWRIGPIKR